MLGEVPADGHCQFAALARQLQRGGTEVIPRTHRSPDRSSERLLLGTTVHEQGRCV